MKNLNILKSKEANNFFSRNKGYYKKIKNDSKLINLIQQTKIKAKNTLTMTTP